MLIGINILSVRSSVAFAPYLSEAFREFIDDHSVSARVPRQGGKGFVVRSDGDLVLRHEHRQELLGPEDVRHYAATTRMRSQVYNVLRMQDEVVLASIGPELLLSHPQSEVWLSRETVGALVEAFGSGSSTIDRCPEWLKVSSGAGRLLLSDQRTGRWVLLGVDHMNELRERIAQLASEPTPLQFQSPPVINLKGIGIHLQSARTLVSIMEDFVAGREVIAFEEVTPIYSFKVSTSANGLEISDDDNHAVVNTRETRKWIDLVKSKMEELQISQLERGRIRTVFASDNGGRWILQWGDEVFVPVSAQESVGNLADTPGADRTVMVRRIDGFLMVMNSSSGNCVALTESEAAAV